MRQPSGFQSPEFHLLVAMVRIQPNVESAVASVGSPVPLVFSFLAGVVARVNPCGFMMLPTYVAYHLGSNEEGYYDRSVLSRSGRGLPHQRRRDRARRVDPRAPAMRASE